MELRSTTRNTKKQFLKEQRKAFVRIQPSKLIQTFLNVFCRLGDIYALELNFNTSKGIASGADCEPVDIILKGGEIAKIEKFRREDANKHVVVVNLDQKPYDLFT